MVLESLLSERLAEKSLASNFIVAAVLASAAIFAGYLLFPNFASILSVILISIGTVPLMMRAFDREERLDEMAAMGKAGVRFVMHRYGPMRFFMSFFVSIAIVVGLWQLFLPNEVSSLVFAQQNAELEAISSSHFSLKEKLHGQQTPDRETLLMTIVSNNLKIMLATFALSLLFGGGAAFILSWNSAVLGVLLGKLLQQQQGLASAAVFVYAIPEFFIYYLMGIAGGVLSIGIIKYALNKKKNGRKLLPFLLRDTLHIFVFAVALLFAAAFIEVLLIS